MVTRVNVDKDGRPIPKKKREEEKTGGEREAAGLAA
jgi:hypothetical protein